MARLLAQAEIVSKIDSLSASSSQDDVKRLLALVWKLVRPVNKERFLEALDSENNIAKVVKQSARELQETEVFAMLKDWQQVVANVDTDDRAFALSIMSKRKNTDWWPSEAQITRMRSLWARRGSDDGGDE